MHMVIVRLTGGLGNQMFQYAAGRSLAIAKKCELKLDISKYEEPNEPREYSLGQFNIHEIFATQKEIRKYTSLSRGKEIVNNFLNVLSLPAYFRVNIFEENHFEYDCKIRDVPGKTYLKGFWQSEKYFREDTATIKRELSINYQLNDKTSKLLEDINSKNAVCLFVRRAELVSNPLHNSYHGYCELQYYLDSITYLQSKLESPYIYIFSDDPQWCVDNFKMDNMMFVPHDYAGDKYVNYFYVMTKCKHFIIPNSTYGWWAAWLCDNSSKIVIAPRQWFNKNQNINTKDLFPETWIQA